MPLGFSLMPYLAKGSGPYVPGNLLTPPPSTRTIVGQLSPWPGAVAPAPTSCPATPPTTLTTSTLPTSTPSAGPSTDTITITSATTSKGQGQTTLSVTATTNNAGAKLSCSAAGTNPIPATPITKAGDGTRSFNIRTKGNVDSVAVTSDKGGSATRVL